MIVDVTDTVDMKKLPGGYLVSRQVSRRGAKRRLNFWLYASSSEPKLTTGLDGRPRLKLKVRSTSQAFKTQVEAMIHFKRGWMR